MNDNTLKSGSYLKHGDYSILKVLGQGGFGITYLAEQTGLGRQVAVKEFFMKEYCNREDATSHVSVGSEGSRELVERFRAKFVKEARLIASLNHANIIRIHDVFEENGTAYYVMDYLPGGSVSDILKKVGSLSIDTAIRYTRQIGEALDYIHTRPDPLNHLDVKPSNIMLDDNGDAVLVDFGLSKRYDAGGHQTSSTPVGVSHGYAPLEQYKDGGVKEFSPTTDIYSLGATLYKMLTGETPPQALDVNEYGLPPMPEFIPANIRSAIEKAMQPRKKDRPQGVKEFLGMLESSSARLSGSSAGESEETVVTKTVSTHKPTSAQPRAQSQKLKSQPQKPNNSKPAAASKPAAPSSGKKRGWLKWFLIGLAAVVVLSLLARGCGNSSPEPDSVSELSDSIPTATNSFINGHEYVDLGLSVKWATCNVGANSSENYGSYFAWGETSPKIDYSWSTVKYCTEGDDYDNVKFSKYVTDSKYGSVDNKTVLDLSDDVARANWGDSWRMPTELEFRELIDKCTWTWTTVNGKNGYKVVSKMNGNSIFLPAAGYRYHDDLGGAGFYGTYWSSSLDTDYPYKAYGLSFGPGFVRTNSSGRYSGLSVRPVFR